MGTTLPIKIKSAQDIKDFLTIKGHGSWPIRINGVDMRIERWHESDGSELFCAEIKGDRDYFYRETRSSDATMKDMIAWIERKVNAHAFNN
jgi:hypothetical protein